ncbi:uncharacterized protein B0H18DRAFT_1012765 [Fomitopsis serialis]|uniref:uncharacterized protein n=1 Tax=Fomitopsis serialis TaxID=139415 RepID=UPI00200872EA|nr:uncharacterized protein B0H18DRAFT_1012765 [Neoantrodia serialis]KAH9924194.1 hypothetical protein B0H18DRAFT_1012765 [Neoantrodia serialis]
MASLQLLRFHGLAWKLVQPHVQFFRLLSYFTSVLELSLTECHFQRVELVLRMIDALPHLERLKMTCVTFASPHKAAMPCASSLSKSLSLKNIAIVGCYGNGSSVRPFDPNLYQGILGIYIAYPNIEKIKIDLTYFLSYVQFMQFVSTCHFAQEVHIIGEPNWGHADTVNSVDILPIILATGSTAPAHVRIEESSCACISQLLDLASLYCQFQNVYIELKENPSEEFQLQLFNTLQTSGPPQTYLAWSSLEHANYLFPDVVANMTKKSLFALFAEVPLSQHCIQQALMSILPYTPRSWVNDFHITFSLQTPIGSLESLDTLVEEHASVNVLHAMLWQHPFCIQSVDVHITFGFTETTPALHNDSIVAAMSALVTSFVILLFRPWIRKGILTLRFPDGSEMIPGTYSI